MTNAITNKTNILATLAEYHLSPLKKLGQNFLCDANIVENIVESIPADRTGCVLEVGPGLGALTRRLAQKVRKVVAVELDAGMVRVLQDTFSDCENVVILHQDILKADLSAISSEHFGGQPFHVCGNLPYYITAKCLLTLAQSGAQSMTAMVQKEVAERLCAQPVSRNYGSITASLRYYGKIEQRFTVSKNCFYPAPDVESAVIFLDLNNPALCCRREDYVFIVRSAFASRRKTIFNNLSAASPYSKDRLYAMLDTCGIDPKILAEMLSPEQFCRLTQEYFQKN